MFTLQLHQDRVGQGLETRPTFIFCTAGVHAARRRQHEPAGIGYFRRVRPLDERFLP